MVEIRYVEPLPRFVVCEEIHTAVFGMSKVTINGRSILGAQLDKIVRRVAQVSTVAEYYQDGERVSGSPSLWSFVKNLTGISEYQKRLTSERVYTLVYAAALNRIETFGYKFDLPGAHRLFSYGVDPIPSVRLTGNAMMNFYSDNGGEGVLRCVALYDAERQSLSQVPPTHATEMLKGFLKGAEVAGVQSR
jgi:hypothetical protein